MQQAALSCWSWFVPGHLGHPGYSLVALCLATVSALVSSHTHSRIVTVIGRWLGQPSVEYVQADLDVFPDFN